MFPRFEDLRFVAIIDWMLFPDERICSHRVKVVKILCSKRAKFEKSTRCAI